MLLAIDIGNTNVVIGAVNDSGEAVSMSRLRTDHTQTSDEYAIKIKSMLDMKGIHAEDITDCIISSVVPPVTGPVKRAIKLITGKSPMMVGPGIKTGLNILIDNPAQLGSDLVVDAVATTELYSLPAVVIDMGTATTLSVVDEGAKYLGGMIMPGPRSSLGALAANAAQLPSISIEEPACLIGKNTVDCMRSGVAIGHAAAIDGMITRIEKELGKKVTVVATGGLSSIILPYCDREIIYDDQLLLKGLYLIYRKNIK
ncbi:MAG: type III pantothenate kinase [Clostridia bacterium]|nr:type III pantothenate kinase [Clostridia bacterium]